MNLPDQQYRVIYIDPPWAYANWSDKKNGAARAHYDCMSVADMCKLPIGDLADPVGCGLIMWITGPAFAEARQIPLLDAWGFKPVTTLFVWRKLTKNFKPLCGLGFHTRHGYEYAILARRGKFSRRKEATKVMQEIDCVTVEKPVERPHSKKPIVVYDRIEELYEGPYVEIFARNRRVGWDSWGNQLPKE